MSAVEAICVKLPLDVEKNICTGNADGSAVSTRGLIPEMRNALCAEPSRDRKSTLDPAAKEPTEFPNPMPVEMLKEPNPPGRVREVNSVPSVPV